LPCQKPDFEDVSASTFFRRIKDIELTLGKYLNIS